MGVFLMVCYPLDVLIGKFFFTVFAFVNPALYIKLSANTSCVIWTVI